MLRLSPKDIKRFFKFAAFRGIDLFPTKLQTTIQGICARTKIFLSRCHFSEVCAVNGNRSMNVVPTPGSVSKEICPPCFFTTVL